MDGIGGRLYVPLFLTVALCFRVSVVHYTVEYNISLLEGSVTLFMGYSLFSASVTMLVKITQLLTLYRKATPFEKGYSVLRCHRYMWYKVFVIR